jgi:hypothetical protein
MKQKDRRELRSNISKKTTILENPEETHSPEIENATQTPNKNSGHID